jgi:hypothetical protein
MLCVHCVVLLCLQGLGWYTAALQLDADGDAAHAFYQEQQQPQPGSSSQLQQVRVLGGSAVSGSAVSGMAGAAAFTATAVQLKQQFHCNSNITQTAFDGKQLMMSAHLLGCSAAYKQLFCVGAGEVTCRS